MKGGIEEAKLRYREFRGADYSEQAFDDRYIGSWESLLDWAKAYIAEVTFLEHDMHAYFDHMGWVDGLVHDGDLVVLDKVCPDDGVHVFWGHS